MPYSMNLRFLVGKLETTAGTMETLDSSDFDVKVRNPEVSPIIEPDDEASKYANGNHGEDEVVMGAQSGTISFSVRMGYAGDDTTEPNWFKFANGAGLKTVTYAGTGIALQPAKEYDNKTMTIWVYDLEVGGASPAGVVYQFAGCIGQVNMGASGIGQPWMAEFTFTGKLVDIVDVENASLPEIGAIDTSHPEKFLNNTVQIDGQTECISSFQLDTGNEVNPYICQSQSTGYNYFQITSRKPRLSMDPLMSSVATEDVWGRMTSGLTGAISTGVVTVASNNFTLTVPKAQQIQANVANREGLINWDANFKCLANGVTGAISDSDLDPEITFELLIGSRT